MIELRLVIEASDRQAAVQALREALRRIEAGNEHRFRMVGRRKSDNKVLFRVECTVGGSGRLAEADNLSPVAWNAPARRGSSVTRYAAALSAMHASVLRGPREQDVVPTAAGSEPRVEVLTDRGDALVVSLGMQGGSRRVAVYCRARSAPDGTLKHAVIDVRLPEDVSVTGIAQHADTGSDDGVSMHVTGVGTSRFLWILHGEAGDTETWDHLVSFKVDRSGPLNVDVHLDLAVRHSRWGIPWTSRADAAWSLCVGEPADDEEADPKRDTR